MTSKVVGAAMNGAVFVPDDDVAFGPCVLELLLGVPVDVKVGVPSMIEEILQKSESAQRVLEEAIEIATDGTDGFHLSFDVDGCDESIAPGTGTIVPGGANLREAHLLMENVADTGQLASLEITEVNPLLDVRNQTAELAVDLIESALGKLVL